MTRLPRPEQWVLQKLNEMEVAEMIERHIDYVDKHGNSVHLPMPFVRHYMRRHDGVLPTVVTIATLPIVLADGGLLAPGWDETERGIIFLIPEELRKIIPKRKDCTPAAVKQAMQFLCDEWLCDVATDYAGKCVPIAAALSIIERTLLPDRPTFFITAGRRGNGKTTILIMLIMAVTGLWPAAAAWSTNEEERRKQLLAYFLYGVSYILWDNIARGTQISCPHIERSCTSAFYSDRRLGVSETATAAASAIHLFTGNNIGPRGDLASRSLEARLQIHRVDPENRSFGHPDPVGWTEDNRAEILAALYTILLGNPMLNAPRNAPCKTRFKLWWRLIGSAIEHAAGLMGNEVDFQKLFLMRDEEDEESDSLGDALNALDTLAEGLPERKFTAGNVVGSINNPLSMLGAVLRDFLYPGAPPTHIATPKSVGKLLRRHLDDPVRHGDRTLILRKWRDPGGGPNASLSYFIEVLKETTQ
jgi:hypothetical protein